MLWQIPVFVTRKQYYTGKVAAMVKLANHMEINGEAIKLTDGATSAPVNSVFRN